MVGAKRLLSKSKVAPGGAVIPHVDEEPAATDVVSSPMPPPSCAEFFSFLQCQLRMEASHLLGKEFALADPRARAMWDDYKAFVTPNMGANERWVPYHTAFGCHEFFLIDSVHHRQAAGWDEKRRFMSMFVFRAHCKRDLFTEVQLPFLLEDSFWQNPEDFFKPGGKIEKAMLQYRRTTRRPLLTLCFRMIPERVLKDDDENLVRSITTRTQKLLVVAEKLWPIVKDPKTTSAQKFAKISSTVQSGDGLGETWAKMLLVCIDLAYPDLQLLESQCEVGVGALGPLRVLVPITARCGRIDDKAALRELIRIMNSSDEPESAAFWKFLPQVEKAGIAKFTHLHLLVRQLKTKPHKMSAVTAQVQLCEYRQFRNHVARSKFGLAGDESMALPENQRSRQSPEDIFHFDESRGSLRFEIPVPEGEEDSVNESEEFEVCVKMAGSRKVAERIGLMCLQKLKTGATKEETEMFSKELYAQCRMGLEDAPEDSDAWRYCKVNWWNRTPVVSFHYPKEGGGHIAFQTTAKVLEGNMMEAERIARLCWAMYASGAEKETVFKHRNELYKESLASIAACRETGQKRRKIN